MVCAPVRSIITSLKLGDYLSVQAHKPCSISHVEMSLSKIQIDLKILSKHMALHQKVFLDTANISSSINKSKHVDEK